MSGQLLWPILTLVFDISDLDDKVHRLLASGYAFRSRRSYATGFNRYMKFTQIYGIDPLDLSEVNLLRFIAHLFASGLLVGTIKVYISGVRSWFVTSGLPIPTLYTPRVKLALKSIERDCPPPSRVRPLTFSVLSRVFHYITPTNDHLMYMAALSLAYYACLRSSEYCHDSVLSQGLVFDDIRFLSTPHCSMSLRVRASKTLIHGFNVVLGCSSVRFCSVCLMRSYVAVSRPSPHRSLFMLSDGSPLTYKVLSRFIKWLVAKMGLEPSAYSPHSLRAGSATDAAAKGAPSHFLQALGRWRSPAYLSYLRPSPLDQAGVSLFLATDQN